jgi:hypothetical protein
MKTVRSIVSTLFLLLLIFAACHNGRKGFRRQRKNYKKSKKRGPEDFKDPSNLEAPMAKFRPLLKDLKLVGYIHDSSDIEKLRSTGYEDVAEEEAVYFYNIQYSLAPTILLHCRKTQKLVAYLKENKQEQIKKLKAKSYEVELELAGGLILFRERP